MGLEIQRKDGEPIEIKGLIASGTGQNVYHDESGELVLKVCKPGAALAGYAEGIKDTEPNFNAPAFFTEILKTLENTKRIKFPLQWSVEPSLLLVRSQGVTRETIAFWQTYYRDLLGTIYQPELAFYSCRDERDEPFFSSKTDSFLFLDWDRFLYKALKLYSEKELTLNQICDQIREWGEQQS